MRHGIRDRRRAMAVFSEPLRLLSREHPAVPSSLKRRSTLQKRWLAHEREEVKSTLECLRLTALPSSAASPPDCCRRTGRGGVLSVLGCGLHQSDTVCSEQFSHSLSLRLDSSFPSVPWIPAHVRAHGTIPVVGRLQTNRLPRYRQIRAQHPRTRLGRTSSSS